MAFSVTLFLIVHRETSLWLQAIFLYSGYCILIGCAHLFIKSYSSGAILNYALLALDSFVVTGFIFLTGGGTSPLYIFYLPLFGLTINHRNISAFVYASALSFALYGGLLAWQVSGHQMVWAHAVGHIIILVTLTGVLYALVQMMMRDEKLRQKLLSRAKTSAEVADVLSGSLTNSRDWIKNVSKLIEAEIHDDGLQCRIVVHRGHQQFLPPSGEKLGVHYPIMVGECVFGTLVVTREKNIPLYHFDQDFFSTIARSFGLSLHRAKLWEDFQGRLEKMQGQSPIDTMIDVIKSEQVR